MLDERTINMHT